MTRSRQHASNKSGRKIADGLDALVKAVRPTEDDDQDDDGTAGELVPVA